MNERQRIEKIMEMEQMNAKQFAQEVGISAGTLSNILGGRNNPSLDVMQSILNRFRTIESDWLILGIGSMYRLQHKDAGVLFDIKPESDNSSQEESLSQISETAQSANNLVRKGVEQERRVEKILVFYSDGTFEER